MSHWMYDVGGLRLSYLAVEYRAYNTGKKHVSSMNDEKVMPLTVVPCAESTGRLDGMAYRTRGHYI